MHSRFTWRLLDDEFGTVITLRVDSDNMLSSPIMNEPCQSTVSRLAQELGEAPANLSSLRKLTDRKVGQKTVHSIYQRC